MVSETSGFNELVISKTFNERQQRFIELAGKGTDLSLAVREAGYEEKEANNTVWRLMRSPAILAAIQVATARELANSAPLAAKVLRDIAGDETADKRLRVVCAKTLLDRAGHIAPSNAHETPLNEMSTAELRALADKLEGELSGRAKDVSSAKAAPRKAQTIEDLM